MGIDLNRLITETSPISAKVFVVIRWDCLGSIHVWVSTRKIGPRWVL